MGTHWSDASQFQGTSIDDTYPHRVFSFRTNSGNNRDTLALENARRSKSMLDRGRLDLVIPYYFFRPGQANCDLHREILQEAGLWLHPKTATLVDVEGDNGKISGDQSFEVNDEVARIRGWYGHRDRVIGYWNPNADPGLWQTRPPALRLIIPQYGRSPGDLSSVKNAQARTEAFAHQFTETGRCAPFPGNACLDYSPLELPDLIGMLGIIGGNAMVDVIKQGAEQLRPFAGLFRRINNPDNVNTDNPDEAWPYAAWADIWNETVWDGFKLPIGLLEDDAGASQIAWVLDTNKRVRNAEEKLDAILAILTAKKEG